MPRASSPDPDIEESDDEPQDIPHKHSLKKLAAKDPEFYEFLLENEKSLLDFDDDAIDEEDDESDNDIAAGDGTDSKESSKIRVNGKLLSQWSEKLRSNDIKTIRCLIEAFRAAVAQASGDEEFESRYKVSPNAFNDILKACYIDLTPAIHRLLGLSVPGYDEEKTKKNNKLVNPIKCKNWKSIAGPIRKYLVALNQTLHIVTDVKELCSLLRHTLHMIPFIMCTDILIKKFLRRTCQLWSQGQEEVRVLSFLAIVRMIRDGEKVIMNYVIKKLYLTFMSNCKLTTIETFPMIRFMQQSLVELYSLDQSVTYSHAFEYLRQSAVYLRNMMTAQVEKDAIKKIYNWGYVHSLILWQRVICSSPDNPNMRTLVFPYVEIVIGTIKLHPTSQFEPMRFHLIRSLISLSESLDVFIPILPLLVNVINRLEYSKTRKYDEEERQIDLSCTLKVSKSIVHTKAYREAVVKELYGLLLEYLSTQSHVIAFPEMVFPAVLKMKKFLKDKCRSSEDGKLLKQAVDKIEENSKFVESRRKGVTFKFNDNQAVNKWENELKKEGTPLKTFFTKWKSLHVANDARERNKAKKRKVIYNDEESEEEAQEEPREANASEEADSSKKKINSKERQDRQKQREDRKKKKKKDKVSKEKTRIREILSKGTEGEEFKLSGIELSDDDDQ